ncbi:MAG TPA: hypothetical protein VFY17_06220, partial [Pilimelia sp.]|nr:hypothetical protein [Pilimelia sp.]
MPVLRAIGLLFGGLTRVLFGGLARVLFGAAARGRAGRPAPGRPADDLRHLRHLHAAACASDTLAAVGVLRQVLSGGDGPQVAVTLTALGAALPLAALLALALRVPGPRG